MKPPTFNIQLASNSADSRVTLNGEDISSAIRAVTVSQIAGQLPIVTLELSPGHRGEVIRAQCEVILRLQDASEE